MKEKIENVERKGSADAQTVSQPEQQARHSQRGAGVETQQAQGQNMVDRAELEMGDEPPSRYLVDQGVSTRLGVAAGATQGESPDLDGPVDEIVSAVRLRGSVIELASRVKERPVKVLLDSGTTGNFISYAMATVLKLKITSNVDFQDLTLADGSKVWTARYVQFTMNCGGYKGKIIARVFPNLSKEYILGIPWLVQENPIID